MPRGSLAISENFGDLLDARFSKIYTTEYNISTMYDPTSALFGMETSTNADERVSGIGGLSDVEDFDGQISYDTPSQLYDKTFEFPEKAKGMKVERKLYDDDRWHIMDGKFYDAAVAVARTREKLSAAIFNGAFTGTDGPDSLSLCHGSHPYSPDDATTQSNSGSSALSATSIEATRRIGHTDIFNDRGELMIVNYDTILCTINNEEKAYHVINSSGQVNTANNNPNIHKGRYTSIIWDRLTDSNNWWMIDSRLSKRFLLWWDRVKPDFKYDRDFDTMSAKWSVYYRATCGWASWLPVYGHNVT